MAPLWFASRPAVRLLPSGEGRIWETSADRPALDVYGRDEFTPYLFRVMRDDGSTSYRTDLYSRWQVGQGSFDPQGRIFGETTAGLYGSVSCSAVVDPDTMAASPASAETSFAPCADFWRDEYDPAHPVPSRVEDLVIYELHIGALGVGRPDAGNFEDALALLDDHVLPLGVNAVELLPLAQFSASPGDTATRTTWPSSLPQAGAMRSCDSCAPVIAAASWSSWMSSTTIGTSTPPAPSGRWTRSRPSATSTTGTRDAPRITRRPRADT